jgi:two-component system sensor histidine kinase/response regulator
MQHQPENCRIERDASTNPAPLRILLADDSRVIQALLAHVLKSLGHEVTMVATGLAAFEITGKQKFDLVFMDIEMPVMDGVEATLAIRKRDAVGGWRPPIIAMTAHASGSFEQHCRAIGMDGYISKPVETKELCAVLDQLDRCSSSNP